MKYRMCVILASIACIAIPVAATPPVEEFLREGRIQDGLEAHAAASSNEELFSLAVLQALDGLQEFSAGMNKLGINPEMTQGGMPFMRAVVTGVDRLAAEPATPAMVSGVFKDLRAALRRANATLARMDDQDFGVEINLSQVRMDFDGDGKIGPDETLMKSMGRLLSLTGTAPFGEDIVIRFDSADAMWLKGYTHFLSGLLDVLLAYDWMPVWNHCAHLIFLRPDPPPAMQQLTTGDQDSSRWVDLIAAIHDMRLSLVDPDGPRRGRDEFRAMIASSRVCWERVMAETDDDREWIPSPNQTGPGGARITQEQADAWQVVLDELDAVARGEKLLPHWRLREGMGINLDKFVSSPPPLDLILFIQGSAFLRYIEEGPVSSQATWRNLTAPFGGQFGRFAIWIN